MMKNASRLPSDRMGASASQLLENQPEDARGGWLFIYKQYEITLVWKHFLSAERTFLELK